MKSMFAIRSWYQVSIFVCMYVGYMLYIFLRKSFAFLIPIIVEKDKIDKNLIGSVLSALAAAYAIGKFVSGIFVDKFSLRLIFAAGLFGAGCMNLLFSIAPSSSFVILWFLNGLAQGPGWPACAKILQRWYSSKILGTLWSTLSTSMNIPASIGPLLFTNIVLWNGGDWRPIMSVCGTIALVFAFASLFILKDKPEDVGLTLTMLTDETVGKKDIKPTFKSHINKQNMWVRIFSSRYTYFIAFGFLISLMVRSIICSWGPLYLIQEKRGDQYISGLFMAWLEVGGVCGSVVAGYLGDKLVEKLGYQAKGNPRHIIYISCFVIMGCCMFMLRTMIDDVKAQILFALILAFFIGFCAYANISVSGVLVIENAAKDISGTAHASCALFGNVGLMLAGLPFSMTTEAIGWNGAMVLCEIFLFASSVVFLAAQQINCRIGDITKED